jgi:hypothetical protein
VGKRGPPPQGEYGKKTAVFSTRIQPDTRARLEAAAKESRRSLSQELEHRIRRTFVEDDKAFDFYGSQQTAAIMKLIGVVIQSANSISVKDVRKPGARWREQPTLQWLEEPWMFDTVLTAIVHTLLWFRPGGDPERRWGIQYQSEAERIIQEVRTADPSVPITARSNRQHAMALLKDGLRGLGQRPHPHDDWRQKEPPVRILVPKRRKRK